MSIHSRLYPIVEQQGGYFSAGQARRVGLSKALLSYHARQGHLLRVRRGIYRLVAFPETPYADLIVAWLAAGEKAVVSHESALLLYGLTDLLPAKIHLTVPRTASRRQAGVRLHTARLSDDEVTFRHGLPVTTLPRTLVDLIRSGIDAEWIHQAVRQALERGLVSEATLQDEARRLPRNLTLAEWQQYVGPDVPYHATVPASRKTPTLPSPKSCRFGGGVRRTEGGKRAEP